MNIKRILIIDDELDFCNLIKVNLEMMDTYKVDIATEAQTGINLAKTTKPNLILLDIIMPKINGFEVLEVFKKDKDTSQIPVIILTGRADDEARLKTKELYNMHFITKPIGINDLRNKIEEVLKINKER